MLYKGKNVFHYLILFLVMLTYRVRLFLKFKIELKLFLAQATFF